MERYWINADNPHSRYITKVCDILRNGGLVIYPTDTNYGVGCLLSSYSGVKLLNNFTSKFRRNKLHSILCSDFSHLSEYAYIPNDVFRLMKKILPGPYTIILEATSEVPRVCQTKRNTIGVRIPDSNIIRAILENVDSPLLNLSAFSSDKDDNVEDPEEIEHLYQNDVDAFLDIGELPSLKTTVIDLTSGVPNVLREGIGQIIF